MQPSRVTTRRGGTPESTPSAGVVERLLEASETASHLDAYLDPDALVIKDLYTWEHVKRRYYYEEDGSRPRDAEGEIVEFEPAELLGFDPADIEGRLSRGGARRPRSPTSLRSAP